MEANELDKELTLEDDLSERCLNALKTSSITTLRMLTEKSWDELKDDRVLGQKEILAELLDFVQNAKKASFKKD